MTNIVNKIKVLDEMGKILEERKLHNLVLLERIESH